MAIKGRVIATRIKGNQLLVYFSKDPASTVNAVFDLSPDACAKARAEGLTIAASAEEALQGAQAVITGRQGPCAP